AQSYSGPDTVSAVVSGTSADKAGDGGRAPPGFRPPAARALRCHSPAPPPATPPPDPQPKAAGWNKSVVTVTFAGSDATAGIESCAAPKSYSGPDTPPTTLRGTRQHRRR